MVALRSGPGPGCLQGTDQRIFSWGLQRDKPWGRPQARGPQLSGGHGCEPRAEGQGREEHGIPAGRELSLIGLCEKPVGTRVQMPVARPSRGTDLGQKGAGEGGAGFLWSRGQTVVKGQG